jgi:hypothetical protein
LFNSTKKKIPDKKLPGTNQKQSQLAQLECYQR